MGSSRICALSKFIRILDKGTKCADIQLGIKMTQSKVSCGMFQKNFKMNRYWKINNCWDFVSANCNVIPTAGRGCTQFWFYVCFNRILVSCEPPAEMLLVFWSILSRYKL